MDPNYQDVVKKTNEYISYLIESYPGSKEESEQAAAEFLSKECGYEKECQIPAN